jgi:redox-sensitive bicupin YhaK (pirin superfamily)
VHHVDGYPRGNEQLGPAASLAGRDLGQDFAAKDGWNMYHGQTVPGFPQHPHRGFETVTVVRRGLIDHSDSLGATARFGQGDVQWLTAGKGVVHCEMFPLVERERPNPLELFQIWLNLPAADKLVDPHFAMLWGPRIPTVEYVDAAGKRTFITVVAGRLGDAVPPPPPPRSWASRPDSDLAIWTLRLEPGARWTLPAAQATSNRLLSFFAGGPLTLDARTLEPGVSVQVRADAAISLENGPVESELLLLQGRPIGEPVASYGPFVMNSMAEIQQAFTDYRRTEFGGWPWKRDDPVHPREEGRFARHVDGRLERP